MHTFGVPGGSLTADDGWTTAQRARQGRAGERECGRMLARAFTIDEHTYVFHDLNIPGYDANIDHAVVRGLNVLLIDAKRWKPGIYLTIAGKTYRNGSRVPHADKATLAAASRLLHQRLDAEVDRYPELGDVRINAVNLVFPTSSGLTSVSHWKSPGGIRARAVSGNLERWVVRQVAGGNGVASGPLLRVLHAMTRERDKVTPHGRSAGQPIKVR